MLSNVCWFIAICALCNAARLKYNEIVYARRMRELIELIELAAVAAARKQKGLPNDFV